MNEQDMMHGMTYSGQDVTGWIATEKLDGVRAYWDGSTLWTRSGKAISIPDTWRDSLPSGVHLDGELFAGYGNRQAAVNAARYGRFTDDVDFFPFDAPKVPGNYLTRLDWMKKNGFHYQNEVLILNTQYALDFLDDVKGMDGEGLILRHPTLEYHPGRTHLMLKLK